MKHWFERIAFHARVQASRPAIVMEDRAVTWGMLWGAVGACAARLSGLGLEAGKPVGIVVDNPIRHLVLCLALFRSGAPSISLERSLVSTPGLPAPVVLVDTPLAHQTGKRLVAVGDDWFAPSGADQSSLPKGFARAEDICRLALTSGTTGQPKVVSYSVETVGRFALDKVLFGIDASRNGVLCMPGLSTYYGYTIACATLLGGRTLYFASSPGQAVRMIELYGIDFVQLSTEQLLSLTRVAKAGRTPLRSLAVVSVGGSRLTRALLEEATTYVCREIWCRYGASEIGTAAHAPASEVIDAPDLIGTPLPGIEIEIAGSEDRPAGIGEIGPVRLRVSPPSDGWLTGRNPAAAWIDVGDLGYRDRDGRLHVIGRASDAIADREAAELALEAEHAIALGTQALDVAVVPANEGGRTSLWVAMVDRANATDAELSSLLRRRGIDAPARFHTLAALPRGISGKLSRAELKKLLAAEAGKQRGGGS